MQAGKFFLICLLNNFFFFFLIREKGLFWKILANSLTLVSLAKTQTFALPWVPGRLNLSCVFHLCSCVPGVLRQLGRNVGREVFVGWATSCEFHSLLSDLIDAQMASVHS